jgi:predicted permease
MLTDAVRSLRRSRAVCLFVVSILSVTIAAATVTFSVVDAVVFKPLPFEAPDALVTLEHRRGDGVMSQARAFAAVEYSALRDRTDAFTSLAAAAGAQQRLQGNGEPEPIPSARVTASLFDVLGVRPVIGAAFSAANETDGNDRVALIGHGLWTRRFGRDPGIAGRTIQTSSGPLLILGVMPEGFTYPVMGPRPVELWTPYVIPASERDGTQLSSYLHVVGRLRPGVTVSQSQAQADAVRAQFAIGDPQRYSANGRFSVIPLHEFLVGNVRGWMTLVLIAVGLVLLIACANVANILLTQAMHRSRELAIRSSLGASRRRLVGTLLTESVLLSIIALAAATLLAWWGVEVARNSLPRGIARADQIAFNIRVFAAACLATVFTSAIIGMFPAFHAVRTDLVTLLKSGSGSSAGSRSNWRHAILVAEVAFVAILLVSTTLFVSSFVRLVRADLGFDRSRLIVMTSLSGLQGSLDDFVDRLKTIPGVAAVGGAAAGSPPLVASGFEGGSSATRLHLPDAPANEFVTVEFNRVTPDYFAAAAIPLLRGRVFTTADMVASARDYSKADTIVLDDLAASRLFGPRDPVGQALVYGTRRVTVVGVVVNVHMKGPEADSGPQAYLPGARNAGEYAYLIRTTKPPASVIPGIRGAVSTLRPADSSPAQLRLVEDAFRNITERRRFSATAMIAFGILAVLIGASGVYGVMSSLVAQRTREIGVRLALGATPRRMVAMILEQIARHVALGLLIGLPAAWMVSKSFDVVFYQVHPSDLWIYVVVSLVLSAVGVAAALVPARRASQVDPQLALRAD